MANVSFHYGTTRPEASQEYEGGLFFNTNTKQISRCYATGSSPAYAWEDYGGEVKIGTIPSFANSRQGVLYIDASNGVAKVNAGGSDYVVVSSGATITPDTTIDGSSSNTNSPGTKAVYDYVESKFGTTSGQAPTLGSNGKLSSDVIPAAALSEYKGPVSSISGLTGLTAEIGDFATVTNDGTYVLTNTPASTASNWIKIVTFDNDTWRPVQLYDGTNTTDVLSSSSSDNLVFQGGTNVTITKDASNRIVFSATDTNTTYTAGDNVTIDSSNNNRISANLTWHEVTNG